MKKFMYMCMMLLAATLTFTACGSDDDDNPNDPTNPQQQGEVNQDNYYKYQESVNVQNAGLVTFIGEATFANGKCTAMALTTVYPTKQIAKYAWEDYQDDDDAANYTYDGDKTIVYRYDDETIAGLAYLSKTAVCELVKTTIQRMVAALS